MIDLCISGSLSKDIILFSINGETKYIDQFSKEIHFSLEEKKIYRIHFEQKTEQYISRFAENVLNILFLPVRGIFNIVTFNINQNWENDISAFKLSGYIEINLHKDTEILFDLKHGKFDKKTNSFIPPLISFYPNVSIEQAITSDATEVSKKHGNYLQNIASVSMLLFVLLIYLLFVGLGNKLYIACVITSMLVLVFGILVFVLVQRSFKKKKSLLMTLAHQLSHEHS